MHLLEHTVFYDRLFDVGIDIGRVEVEFSDTVICFPTLEWLEDGFTPLWWAKRQKLPPYKPNKSDCDKYARWCWALAAEEHAFTEEGPEAGLAFAEMRLRKDPSRKLDAHSLNAAVYWKDGFKLWVLEPQTVSRIVKPALELELCAKLKF